MQRSKTSQLFAHRITPFWLALQTIDVPLNSVRCSVDIPIAQGSRRDLQASGQASVGRVKAAQHDTQLLVKVALNRFRNFPKWQCDFRL